LFLIISGELEGSQFWHLITTYPTLLLQGSVFRAGKAILFLKELGWTDLEIKSLVFPYHAAILQVGQQLQVERAGFWLLAIGRCLAPIAGASCRAWACAYGCRYDEWPAITAAAGGMQSCVLSGLLHLVMW